ncbi:MAG: serine protease [Pseudomonadota bacterium]
MQLTPSKSPALLVVAAILLTAFRVLLAIPFAGASDRNDTLAISSVASGHPVVPPSRQDGPSKVEAKAEDELLNRLRRSVGMISIPTLRTHRGRTKHFKERCSGTLVNADEERRSTVWVLSAWHCFEDYRDLSRNILFTAANGQKAKARLISSGGSMRADWALLKLDSPMATAVDLAAASFEKNASIVMAGYPKGDAQYDDNRPVRKFAVAKHCTVTGKDEADFASSCVLSKGSSGGAVFAVANRTVATLADSPQTQRLAVADSLENNQASRQAEMQEQRELPRYLGVISRGDSESLSIFVPLHRIWPEIDLYLRRQ